MNVRQLKAILDRLHDEDVLVVCHQGHDDYRDLDDVLNFRSSYVDLGSVDWDHEAETAAPGAKPSRMVTLWLDRQAWLIEDDGYGDQRLAAAKALAESDDIVPLA